MECYWKVVLHAPQRDRLNVTVKNKPLSINLQKVTKTPVQNHRVVTLQSTDALLSYARMVLVMGIVVVSVSAQIAHMHSQQKAGILYFVSIAGFSCSATISVPFGHFGEIRLKGYAKTLQKLTLFEIP